LFGVGGGGVGGVGVSGSLQYFSLTTAYSKQRRLHSSPPLSSCDIVFVGALAETAAVPSAAKAANAPTNSGLLGAVLLAISSMAAGTIGLSAATTTTCDPPPPTPSSPASFGSAAAMFQHHMSKEKEADESGSYPSEEESEREEEEEGSQQKATSMTRPTKETGDCFLCRVHRQGPCGHYWKEMEACLRDTNDGATTTTPDAACLAPLRSFRECWRNHSGLYRLIALDEQGSLVKKMRQEHDVSTIQEEAAGSIGVGAVKVDWGPWEQFLKGSSASTDIVKNYRRRISQNGNVRYRGPLWKRFEKYQVDPYVVTVVATCPSRLPSPNHSSGSGRTTLQGVAVSHVVAIDQQGRVLGYLEAEAAGASSDTTDTDTAQSLSMKVVIVPGLTETVHLQLWTTEEEEGHEKEPTEASASSSRHHHRRRRRFVVHETFPLQVDYGASTNKLMAVQNRRTRTEKVK
jgi:hypothetical protein